GSSVLAGSDSGVRRSRLFAGDDAAFACSRIRARSGSCIQYVLARIGGGFVGGSGPCRAFCSGDRGRRPVVRRRRHSAITGSLLRAPAHAATEVVATEDVIWSAPPPAEPAEDWKAEAPSPDWQEVKSAEAPAPEAPADWSTLSSGPDWSSPSLAEPAAAEPAWDAAAPPPAESQWEAAPAAPA